MGHVRGGEAGALDAAVFAGYLAGLADALRSVSPAELGLVQELVARTLDGHHL